MEGGRQDGDKGTVQLYIQKRAWHTWVLKKVSV